MSSLAQLAAQSDPRQVAAYARTGLVPRYRGAADLSLDCATAVAAAGVAGSLASLTDLQFPMAPAVAAYTVTAAAIVGGRARADRRGHIIELIERTLGAEIGAARVRFIGGTLAPARVRVYYTPDAGLEEDQLGFADRVAAVVTARVGRQYRVTRHDLTRCRVSLRIVPKAAASENPSVEENQTLLRAKRTADELLRGTATLTHPTWTADGKLSSFTVRHRVGTMVATTAQQARIERIMSTMLPGRWRAHWDVEHDEVRFILRSELGASIPHPVTDPSTDLYAIPYGQDEDGNTLSWRLRGPGASPHLLVIGKTGTGKTVCLIGIIAEIARRGWPVWLGDPKRVEFLGLRGRTNIQVVATTTQQIVAMIHRAHEVMEYRYALVEAGEATEDSFPPLFLVLDEYRDFLGALRPWYAKVKGRGAPPVPPVVEALASIVRKGRTGAVHCVIGMQRPDADQLGGEQRDNFAARISVGSLSPQGAQMMWEAPTSG